MHEVRTPCREGRYELPASRNRRPASSAENLQLLRGHSHCTFDLTPFTTASRQPWWEQFDGRRRQCWIAEKDDQILGYACSTRLKNKAVYDTSVEVSVYAHIASTGKGIGAALYRSLLSALADQDLHRAYALIALPNDASLKLHHRFDFQQVAHPNGVGRKFQRYWDVVWLEKHPG